jgi:hypothetical protein
MDKNIILLIFKNKLYKVKCTFLSLFFLLHLIAATLFISAFDIKNLCHFYDFMTSAFSLLSTKRREEKKIYIV